MQWVKSNGGFQPVGPTVKHIPAGAYVARNSMTGPYLEPRDLVVDQIVELPDNPTSGVIRVIRKFWGLRQKYEDHGLIFKRGILLYGPPGSGKSVGINILANELIASGGIVLFMHDVGATDHMLHKIRAIEEGTPIIVIMEDIDSYLTGYEEEILALLDGENQINNVCYVATTNYPEKLPRRLVNRPSRFDERVYIPMPSFASRRAYLEAVAGSIMPLPDETIDKWASDTKDFSLAHLKELVVAVTCLEQPYESVLLRLCEMAKFISSEDEESNSDTLDNSGPPKSFGAGASQSN